MRKKRVRANYFDLYGPRATAWPQGYEVVALTEAMGERQGQMVLSTQISGAEPPPPALVNMDAASEERQKLIDIGFRDESCSLYKPKKAQPGRYLKPITVYERFVPVEERVVPVNVDPWREPDLYRRFARLDCTEASICKFAGKYGHLGREMYRVFINAKGKKSSDRDDLTYIEPIERWIAEIVRLRTAILLLDLSAVDKGASNFESSIDKLESIMNLDHYQSGHYVVDRSEMFKESWFDENEEHQIYRKLFPHHESGSYVNLDKVSSKAAALQVTAKYFATEQVNTELLFGVSPFNTFDKGSPLRLLPRYLLASMYMQFALDLTSRRYLPCSECGSLIEKVERRTKRFCSRACQARNIRRRKSDVASGDDV